MIPLQKLDRFQSSFDTAKKKPFVCPAPDSSSMVLAWTYVGEHCRIEERIIGREI